LVKTGIEYLSKPYEKKDVLLDRVIKRVGAVWHKTCKLS